MEEQSFGSYKVIKKIGAGGMARVYLGVHKDIPNLKVVLKILSDASLVERFKQEADKLALLDGHPNICQIKHFFNHGEDMVIAMEYIDGVTLDDKIKSSGKIPIQESLNIISRVLDILEFAHQKGIYHRDIKPSNIMLDRTERVKVIDFGIAKAKTDPNLTTVGTACGTPAYMAPEQFVPTDETDYAKVDIYAVGTTLYFMLTGRLPFKGDNEFALRDAKLFTTPTMPREVNPEISKPLEEVILKSLKKDPKERYKSACEMRMALEPLITPAPGETELVRPKGEEQKPKGKSKGLLIGVPAAIVLAGILAIIFIPGDKDKKEDLKSGRETTATVVEPDRGVKDTAATIVASKPTAKINITVSPAGDIYIDDSLRARQSKMAEATVDTGVHYIRAENMESLEKRIYDTVRISPDEIKPRSYTFHFAGKPSEEEATRPKPPAMGVVIVGSRPVGGKIYIDGALQARQTPNTFKLRPGMHSIRVQIKSEGGESIKDTTIILAGNDTSRVIFNFEN
jgi:predicted Ser/Thr protein kinase